MVMLQDYCLAEHLILLRYQPSGAGVIQLLIWPVVLHKISWEKPSFIAILVGLGNTEMALS